MPNLPPLRVKSPATLHWRAAAASSMSRAPWAAAAPRSGVPITDRRISVTGCGGNGRR